MKVLRLIVLLGLAVLLPAGCSALPPVFPSSPATPFELTAAAPLEAPTTVPEPATAEPIVAATAAATPATRGEATAAPVEATAVAPTAAVTETVEPAATPSAEQVMGANPLVGTIWEWAAMLKTNPAAQSVVPNPASYTLIFGADGSLLVKADCNNGRATYALDNDTLTVQMGAVTAASCPPGSLGGDFLTSLSKVASYMIDAGDLILRVADTGDSMIYRNGGPSAEPVAPPPTEAVAGAPAETTAPKLAGPVWQWERFVDTAAAKNNFDVQTPEKYTVKFNEDGTAGMVSDCNQAGGTYTVDGANLTVSVGPMTLVACGAGSLSDTFLINLTSAVTYTFEDGKLVVDLMADTGRMIFGAAK